ncbi:MAG: ATP-dependent DNA helicase [Pseudoclavibacter sp.]
MITAAGIAALIHQHTRAAGKPPVPTAEQSRIIEDDGSGPALVVAGAGSGKTTTLMQHLAWLVANGRVAPERILGLTFTRKAAAELDAKVRAGIAAVGGPQQRTAIDAAVHAPTITTYNSYANRLFQDHALVIGREPDSALVTDAAAWELAYEVVADAAADETGRPGQTDRLGEPSAPDQPDRADESGSSPSPGPDRTQLLDELVAFGARPARLADLVLNLAALMVDNGVNDAEVLAYAAQVEAALIALRPAEKQRSARRPDIETMLRSMRGLRLLVPLCAEYERRKRARGLMEYGDQVAGALQIMAARPDLCAAERDQWDVIVLDEYQDTSVSQTRLLAGLFQGLRVMAVGDPNQSIYAWRGASAENMRRFAADFHGDERRTFTLSTSWRNSRRILDAANAVAAPLDAAGVRTLAARPGAGPGIVSAQYLPDVAAEAEACAEWLGEQLAGADPARPDPAQPPTAAVLFRTKRHMQEFSDVLARHDIRHAVVGLGGVIDSPEVTDVRCALAVIADAGAGPELVRLLGGARWRLGPASLVRLGELARRLARSGYVRGHRSDGEQEAIAAGFRASSVADEQPSLVDALDAVADGPGWVRTLFPADEWARLREAAALFRDLRRYHRSSLSDLIRVVIARLGLDVELVANEQHPHPAENLDVLLDKVEEYERSARHPTVLGLLDWIEQLARREHLEPSDRTAEPGVVQLMTVHAAKGLEWDVVSVPLLVDGEFPVTRTGDAGGWMRTGQLPSDLRGDAGSLPVLRWRGLADQGEFVDAVKAYKHENSERALAEERRLAYVAITRARRALLVTGSRFAAGRTRPRDAAAELQECAETWQQPLAQLDDTVPPPAETAQTPWPRDPLGARRERVERAAALVRSAPPADGSATMQVAQALLDEPDAAVGVRLPGRIAASHFHALATDPGAALRDLQRPVPQPPSAASALGTAFHAWVQRRYRSAGWIESIDEDAVASDAVPAVGAFDEAQLRRLQDTFERSRWAGREPVDVELALEYEIGGMVVPCKLDAVFPEGDAYVVVDWKTGAQPVTAADLRQKQYQLALYRLAYAAHRGIDPSTVSACFYYVATDTEIRPQQLSDQDELESVWAGVRSAAARSGAGSGPAVDGSAGDSEVSAS